MKSMVVWIVIGLVSSVLLVQSPEAAAVGTYSEGIRVGVKENIAHLIAFLASPLARYSTHEVIYVDGGMHQWAFRGGYRLGKRMRRIV